MNDGDYKFALKVGDQYEDLLNKINKKKTGGYLIVEIVPKDQDNKNVIKPKIGNKVNSFNQEDLYIPQFDISGFLFFLQMY